MGLVNTVKFTVSIKYRQEADGSGLVRDAGPGPGFSLCAVAGSEHACGVGAISGASSTVCWNGCWESSSCCPGAVHGGAAADFAAAWDQAEFLFANMQMRVKRRSFSSLRCGIAALAR